MDACQRLVRHLNRLGGDRWQVEHGEETGPCRIRSAGVPPRELDIRVVEELEEAPVWRSLARDSEVVWTGTAAALAKQVHRAIARDLEEIPPETERAGTGLLVLAGDAPSLTLATVVETFRRRHGRWAASLGFHGIWITGSVEDEVFTLHDPADSPPPPGHLGRAGE